MFTQPWHRASQWHSNVGICSRFPKSAIVDPVTKLTGLSTRQQGHERVVPNLRLSDARAAGIHTNNEFSGESLPTASRLVASPRPAESDSGAVIAELGSRRLSCR